MITSRKNVIIINRLLNGIEMIGGNQLRAQFILASATVENAHDMATRLIGYNYY